MYVCTYESRPLRRLIVTTNTHKQGLHTHLILPHAPSSPPLSAKHHAAALSTTTTTKLVTVDWLLAMLRAGRVLYVLGFVFVHL